MFDVSFGEMLVIGLLALLVLGPERLPKAARLLGLWVRRARAHWFAVRSELEHELAADELRRSLQATQEELRAAHAQLQRGGHALRDAFDTAPASGHGGASADAISTHASTDAPHVTSDADHTALLASTPDGAQDTARSPVLAALPAEDAGAMNTAHAARPDAPPGAQVDAHTQHVGAPGPALGRAPDER